MNTLLVLGLQVTLVALAGIAVSLTTRKWMSTSGTLPLGATLGAVVLLTVCAFSSWPSWLHRPESRAESRGQSGSPEFARDPATAPFTDTLTPTPWGYATLPRWAETILYGLPPYDSHATESFSKSPDHESPSAAWGAENWLLLTVGGAMLIGLIRVIGGLWAVRLFVRTSRPLKSQSLLEQVDLLRAEIGCMKSVEVRECPQMATAATVGWRRPVVLLSDSWRSWTPEQIRSVLAHEIAHITRGDFLATVAAQVGVVLHFYHPLVHWLANRLRLEQELAADALAAQVVGGSRNYLNAIGELALKQSNEPVGWPAHSFLPTRRTFLRRIEMLRDLKFLSGGTSRLAKWATLASVAAVTLLAIGLRPPAGGLSSPQAKAQTPPTVKLSGGQGGTAVATAAPLEARYVPADAALVIVARPNVISAQFEKLKADQLIPAETENPLKQIAGCISASITFLLPDLNQPVHPEPAGLCLSFISKEARDQAAQSMEPPARISAPGQTDPQGWTKAKFLQFEIEVHAVTGEVRFYPDDRSIVMGHREIVERMLTNGPKSTSPLTETAAWKLASQGALAVAVDATSIQKVMAQAPPNPIAGMFAPLWKNAQQHTLGLTIGESIQLKLVSDARDAEGAKLIEASERVAMNFLSASLQNGLTSPDPTIKKTFEELQKVMNSQKLETVGSQTTLSAEGDLNRVISVIVAPAVIQAREAAQRSQQQSNLKHIILALYNYQDVNGHFPPAVIVDPQTKVARSWRVEILPYLSQAGLYEQYRKNEPWDSENNKKVLAQMPRLYAHPSQQDGSTNTSITAAYGPGLIFGDSDFVGTSLQEVRDGTSNTIALLEAKTDIPWTKPEDLRIDVGQGRLPEFGVSPEGFNVALCDGSVRFMTRQIDPAMLRAMLTASGGEIVDFDRPAAPSPAPAPSATPTPGNNR